MLIMSRGLRWLADVTDMVTAELISGGLLPTMRLGIVDGSAEYSHNTGAEMDQTISGKAVGDTLVIKAGPPTDSRGGEIPGNHAYDFQVSDAGALQLQMDPPDVQTAPGQRAARVTLLSQSDADVLITLARPSKAPLRAVVHFTGVGVETDDAATDFPISVDDGTTPEPPPVNPVAPPVAPPEVPPVAGQTGGAASRQTRAQGF